MISSTFRYATLQTSKTAITRITAHRLPQLARVGARKQTTAAQPRRSVVDPHNNWHMGPIIFGAIFPTVSFYNAVTLPHYHDLFASAVQKLTTLSMLPPDFPTALSAAGVVFMHCSLIVPTMLNLSMPLSKAVIGPIVANPSPFVAIPGVAVALGSLAGVVYIAPAAVEYARSRIQLWRADLGERAELDEQFSFAAQN